jgi:2'-5' RNA ligase
MKATIVLIANDEIENYGRKLMLDAHKAGNLGFEMARLPQHVSLKQPFSIRSLEEMEEFFDEFAKELKPVNVKFKHLNVYPSNVLGYESGCMSIEVEKTAELDLAQRKLFEKLEQRFGPCPAEHDDYYVFHMTIAISGAGFDCYERAYTEMAKKDYNKECVFNRLGLLYYDNDNFKPGTYFCYKILELN